MVPILAEYEDCTFLVVSSRIRSTHTRRTARSAAMRQALSTFLYGSFVGTVLVTGIAVSTFLFNIGGRGWDYLKRRTTKQ